MNDSLIQINKEFCSLIPMNGHDDRLFYFFNKIIIYILSRYLVTFTLYFGGRFICSIPVMKIQLLQFNIRFLQQIISVDKINFGLMYKSFLSSNNMYKCTDYLNYSLNYINKYTNCVLESFSKAFINIKYNIYFVISTSSFDTDFICLVPKTKF